MAAIDKIYTSSYKEYQEVIDWAKEHKFTCPNGIVIDPINYIYEWNEESFNGKELPIMNTSQSLDYYLIKYCDIPLVQNRMKEVYPEDYIKSIKNGTSIYDTFIRPESGTKVKLLKNSSRNKRIIKFRNYFNKSVTFIALSVFYNDKLLWYNEDYDMFTFTEELSEGYSSCATLECKTIKAIIRKIKKWKLPKGATVLAEGRYVGETWNFKIK